MNLMCVIGKHKWDACKCSVCGKAQDHDWNKDCNKCTRCGVERKDSHRWEGCKCPLCGEFRNEGHDWSNDYEPCSRCGVRPSASIFKAAKDGNEQAVNSLLSKFVNKFGRYVTETKDDDGYSVLMLASKNGLTETVKLLLSLGVSVNAVGSVGGSRSWHADPSNLRDDSLDMAKPPKLTPSALILACTNGHIEVVKLLLEKGADVNSRNSDGDTPLIFAVRCGHAGLVKLLLEKGADASVKGLCGQTALYWAMGDRQVDEILDMLCVHKWNGSKCSVCERVLQGKPLDPS